MILVGCCHYAWSNNYQRGTTQQQQKNQISPSLLALQKTFTRYNISKRRIDTILTSIQQQQQQQNANSNKDLFPSFLMKPSKKKETVDLPFSTTAKYTMNRAQLLANHYQNPLIECHYLFLSLLDYQPSSKSKTNDQNNNNNNISTDPSATESNEVWNSVLKPLLSSSSPTPSNPNDNDKNPPTNVTALDLCQTCLAYYDQEIQRRRGAQELVAVGGRRSTTTTTVLDDIGMDLTQMAADQLLDTVFGRDTEIDACCRTLLRRKKNSVILLGPAGVGKTAIVEGLAQRLVRPESCPRSLQNVRLISIEISNLLADTKYRGEFEERLQKIIDEVTASPTASSSSSSPPPRIILFLDEIHTIMGTGNAGEGGGGSIDMANILKPALARGTVQLIGATTLDEYRQSIEKDAAMARRLQPIYITEPNITQCLDILEKSVEYYADYHQVRYTAGAIRAAVELSERYINDRFLPDKAIDLMDEAGAMMQLQQSKSNNNNNNNNIDWNLSNDELFMDNERTDNDADRPLVTEEIIRELISEWSGIPLGKIECSEQEKLVSMETILSSRVVGQPRPIVAVARAIRRARSGLQDPQRPIASFMFCGPTGVGKTELCKTLADLYYGSEKDMIRIDMSEYQDRYTVSRLTGPPPGYVGYESGGQLTEAVRRNAHSLILFDEVEKAHEDVLNILLQVLEDGILTDGKGRTVNFKNTIIVMTSNIGSRRILDLCRTTNTAAETNNAAPSGLDAVRNSMRDTLASAATMDDNDDEEEAEAEEDSSSEPVQDKEHYLYPQLIEVVKEELENTMKPELLNRIDEIVVFSPLSPDNLIQIAQLNVDRIVQRIFAEHNITLSVADSVIQCIVNDGSMNADQFGARPMRRATQRYVEDSISDAFIQGFIQKNDDAITLSMLLNDQRKKNRVVISKTARQDDGTTTTEFVVDVADASGGIGASTTPKSTILKEPINGGYNSTVRDESNTPSVPSTKTYPL